MSNILVFTEFSAGSPKRSSLELLSCAKKSGLNVVAVVLGTSVGDVSSQLGVYGAKEVHLLKDASFNQYHQELFVDALESIVNQVSPKIILAASSSIGKDLFPRLAARLKTSLVSDAIELSFLDNAGSEIVAKKPMYSGKCMVNAKFNNCEIKIVLLRPNQMPISSPTEGVKAQVHEVKFAKKDLNSLIKDIVKGTSEKLDLTEANIIVSGGRGLKEASNFKLLHDLADVLGATVGASRAVVDAGWVGHGMQVGQTGKTVAPSLYIAAGISGAIQHLAGMSSSKVIVAINNDPNAPIFQKANYGIVGDALEILPKLTQEFKKIIEKHN